MAADAALVVVDGVAGVEVQTEKVWSFADDFKLPRAIVINKLDRERSDFERALASVQENFGRAAVPVQIPIGAEKDFKGVVDLVRMKAYTYTADGDGKGKEGDIPADLADAAQKAHEALIEMVAEGNDALMEEFFDKGTLAPEQILDGLRQAIRERRIFRCCARPGCTTSAPIRCSTSSSKTSPRPTEREPVIGKPQRPGSAARHQRQRAGFRVRVQDHGRSVRRPHHLFQSDFRRGQERRQPGQLAQLRRRAPGAHRRRSWARPSSRSPNCTPAISAR